MRAGEKHWPNTPTQTMIDECWEATLAIRHRRKRTSCRQARRPGGLGGDLAPHTLRSRNRLPSGAGHGTLPTRGLQRSLCRWLPLPARAGHGGRRATWLGFSGCGSVQVVLPLPGGLQVNGRPFMLNAPSEQKGGCTWSTCEAGAPLLLKLLKTSRKKSMDGVSPCAMYGAAQRRCTSQEGAGPGRIDQMAGLERTCTTSPQPSPLWSMLCLRFAAAAAAVAHAVNASVFVVNASSDFGAWEGWGTSLCWWVRRASTLPCASIPWR